MTEKKRITNLFMTISGGTQAERDDCARWIEASAKKIATHRGLRVQVAADEETEESP